MVVIAVQLIPDGIKLFLPTFALFFKHSLNSYHINSVKQGEMTMSTLVEGVSHQVSSPQQKTHGGCLLLVRQHFDVSQSCGVVEGHMNFLVPGTTGAAKPAITGDPVTNPVKAGQLFGVDVDHVAGPCPLAALARQAAGS